jgi:hypothetical protein
VARQLTPLVLPPLPTLPALRARLDVAAKALEGPSVAGSLSLHVVFGCLLLMMPRPSLDQPEKPLTVVMVDLPPVAVEPPPPPPAPAARAAPKPVIRQSLPPPIASAPKATPAPPLRLPPPPAPIEPEPAPRVTTAPPAPAPTIAPAPPAPTPPAPVPIAPRPAPTEIAPPPVAPAIPDPPKPTPAPPSEIVAPATPEKPPAAPSLDTARVEAKPTPGIDAETERKRAEAEAARKASALAANGGDEPIPTARAAPPAGGGLRGAATPSGGPRAAGGGAPAIQGFAIGGLDDGPGDCSDPTNAALTDAQRAACNLRWRGVRGLAPVSGVSARDRATFESDLAAKTRPRTSGPATVACKDNLGGECLPDKR